MINGFRVFQVDGNRGDRPENRVHQAVSVDSIRKGN
jgi:hypothetical protein